tara:strand:- start:476 stop:886 length:411 start_codon:yes stop_codon:yes gene_type:complete
VTLPSLATQAYPKPAASTAAGKRPSNEAIARASPRRRWSSAVAMAGSGGEGGGGEVGVGVARAAVAGAAVARAAVAAVAMAAVAMAGAALPCHSCSTLWRDPETRGAVPRAGLRRHAFAVRLAGLLLSSNEKTPPK